MDMQNGHNSRSKHSDMDESGDNQATATTTSTAANRVANKRKRGSAHDATSTAGTDSDTEQKHQPSKKLRTIRPRVAQAPVESDVPQSSSQSSSDMPATTSARQRTVTVSSDLSSVVDVDGYAAPDSEPPPPPSSSQPASTVDDAAWIDAAEIVANEDDGDDDDDYMEPEYYTDGTSSSTESDAQPSPSPEHHNPHNRQQPRAPKSPASQARAIVRAKIRARERKHYRITEGHLLDGNDLAADARHVYERVADAAAHAAAETAAVAALMASASTAPAAAAKPCVFGVGRNATPFGSEQTKPADRRLCPLPPLAWASAADVWRLMCRKDERALLDRDPAMLDRHPGIHARMRAILLDWLMEVCEVYKLHRETYYLAVDYLDRYITNNERLPKTRLQLIGITCLFTAAKVEEIYPPKISEFAYVTDGACTETDIIQQEMILMLGLGWSINPVTIIGWLSVYMQLNCSNRAAANFGRLHAGGDANGVSAAKQAALQRDIDAAFVYPQFSAMDFVLAARVLDLCTLDVEMANFQYSVVAAAVLVLTIDRETALRVSGFEWHNIKPCVKWMEPFFEVVMLDSSHLFLAEQNEQIRQSYGLRHLSTNITTDDSHIIQTHTTSVALFEDVHKLRERNIAQSMRANRIAIAAAGELKKKQQSTPAAITKTDDIELLTSVGGPLTPPDSNRKLNDSLPPTAATVSTTPVATANGSGSGGGIGVGSRLTATVVDAASNTDESPGDGRVSGASSDADTELQQSSVF